MIRSTLAAWFVAAFLITGSLASAHWYALPRPDTHDPRLLRRLADRASQLQTQFVATHILYLECRCSQRIIDHLLARAAHPALREDVLLVGPTDERADKLKRRLYHVESITPLELRQHYGVEAAPLLIVSDRSGAIHYMGGYTLHKQDPSIQDTRIIDSTLARRTTAELPLLGCAMSKRLRDLMDPFGLQASAAQESFE